MLSINTNLQSLIGQNSLKNSTLKLNTAIERLSTGFKINGAKDNAANQAITTGMSTQIGSYEIAEENTANGLDLLTTANDNLDLINDRLERLRALSEQAANGTYGEQSLQAINEECNALVDEINRLYLNTEYNGAKLFIQNDADITQVLNADKNTTFEELGIGASSFSVYNKEGALVETYDTEAEDSIGDLFDVLKTQGFNCSISGGMITLSSDSGNYIAGDLADALGITTTSIIYTASSSQTSASAVTYQVTVAADITTTLDELGITSNSVITVKDELGNQTGTFNVGSSDTIESLFNSLNTYGISGSISNGVITLSSTGGFYAEGTALSALGINTQNGNVITVTKIADLSTAISDVYSGSSQSVTVVNQKTGTSSSFTLGANAALSDLQTQLGNNSVTMTMTDGVISLTSNDSTYLVEGDLIDALGIGTSAAGAYTVTTGNTLTSATPVTYTVTTTTENITTTVVEPTAGFSKEIDRIDTDSMVSITKYLAANDTGFTILPAGTYAIKSIEDLLYFSYLSLLDNTAYNEDYTFVLGADLDLTEYYDIISSNNYDGWLPIGTQNNPFKGTFDGNGYTISNLKIDSDYVSSNGAAGFFGYCDGATIKNLGIEDVAIDGDIELAAGGLAAICLNTTIDNCYTTGLIKENTLGYGANGCGGIVGYAENTNITNCSSSVDVQGGSYIAGGIAGFFCTDSEDYISYMTDCYSTGNISGSCIVGGLVGSTFFSVVDRCYHSGDVQSNYCVGGLIGIIESNSGSVNNSYSTSNIYAAYVNSFGFSETYIGGLVGLIVGSSYSINNCYVTGTIDGDVFPDTYAGGLVGRLKRDSSTNELTIKDSYMLASSNILTGIGIGGQNADTIANSSNCYYNPNLINNNLLAWSNTSLIAGATSYEYEITEISDTEAPYDYKKREITTTTVTTTSTLTMSEDTTLSELGVTSDSALELNGAAVFNYYTNETIKEFQQRIQAQGLYTNYLNGILMLGGIDNFICADSGNLLNVLNMNISDAYSVSTKTLYANTDSGNLTKYENFTTKVNTTSNSLNSFELNTLSGTTTMGELGYNSNFNITIFSDGTKSTIAVNKNTTADSLIASLQGKGLNASINNGIFSLSGNGVSYISNNIFKLAKPVYTTADRPANTGSDKLQYEVELSDLVGSSVYAPGSFTLQVGIYADENSQITIQTSFLLPYMEQLRNIGLESSDFMSQIDSMMNTISAKQVEYGAAQNRLESALYEISTHYENLVSARSTLRDADIAEVSSDYIRQQILQQASATLMAAANQNPALALQLL